MAARSEAPAIGVADVLGASRLLRTGRAPEAELLAAVRRGLPFSAFEAVAEEVQLPRKELAALLGVPDRTIARRKDERLLTPAESDRLYRLARVVAHAASVLGSIEKARAWLKHPIRALGDAAPLAFLDTDIGARRVDDVLLRLDHGIHG